MKIAIYSRKSVFTGKGESIENQIQLCKDHCEVYFKNSLPEYIIYEDEGFSGKNVNRPKFQKLLEDIKLKQINILICYRLDRISRSVSDFSSILELLQKYNVDFISINERFDTSTPNGRAMIYISSVFAQLERETIAERVRDNMLQLAKMGKWSGGQLPLGYTSEKVIYMNEEMKEKSFIKLIPIAEELEIIKLIYKNYLTKGSILNVVKELNFNKLTSKTGCNFELTGVKRILRNPLYTQSNKFTHEYLEFKNYNVFGTPNGNGYLTYNKKNDKNNIIVAISNHEGIISSDDWLHVQKKLDSNAEKSKQISNRTGTGDNETLFSGLLKCGKCGSNMVIKYNGKNKEGKSALYYVCSNKNKTFLQNRCDIPNLRCEFVDPKIVLQIKAYNKETVIEFYNNKLNELLKDSNKQMISMLKTQIQEKKMQIDNLVDELSLTPDNSMKEIFRSKINELNNELNQLNLTITNTELIKNNINDSILQLKNLIKSFMNFHNYFDNTSDINTKRNLLRNIIKDIRYDAENKIFDVDILGLDNMQLDSTSEPLDRNLHSSQRRCNSRFT